MGRAVLYGRYHLVLYIQNLPRVYVRAHCIWELLDLLQTVTCNMNVFMLQQVLGLLLFV